VDIVILSESIVRTDVLADSSTAKPSPAIP